MAVKLNYFTVAKMLQIIYNSEIINKKIACVNLQAFFVQKNLNYSKTTLK